jgi:hypothetical protein
MDLDESVKYPNVTVILTGQDGNAFMILGLVTRAMKNAKMTKAQIDEYRDEAMLGDYDHLLRTTMKYVNVE